jgi:hypothetical protein
MRKAGCQTNRGGRFTAATLLIGQRNDFGVKQMHTPRATTSVEVISRAVYCYTSITVKLIFLSPDFGPLCAGCLIDSVEAASTAVCCYTSITLDFLISWPGVLAASLAPYQLYRGSLHSSVLLYLYTTIMNVDIPITLIFYNKACALKTNVQAVLASIPLF